MDGDGDEQGAAYLLYGGDWGTGGPVDTVAHATLPGEMDQSGHGLVVSFLGDVTGDGLPEFAVGAPLSGDFKHGEVPEVCRERCYAGRGSSGKRGSDPAKEDER